MASMIQVLELITITTSSWTFLRVAVITDDASFLRAIICQLVALAFRRHRSCNLLLRWILLV